MSFAGEPVFIRTTLDAFAGLRYCGGVSYRKSYSLINSKQVDGVYQPCPGSFEPSKWEVSCAAELLRARAAHAEGRLKLKELRAEEDRAIQQALESKRSWESMS